MAGTEKRLVVDLQGFASVATRMFDGIVRDGYEDFSYGSLQQKISERRIVERLDSLGVIG
jgi:hypothetical protein